LPVAANSTSKPAVTSPDDTAERIALSFSATRMRLVFNPKLRFSQMANISSPE
jgi:hypothetical protein